MIMWCGRSVVGSSGIYMWTGFFLVAQKRSTPNLFLQIYLELYEHVFVPWTVTLGNASWFMWAWKHCQKSIDSSNSSSFWVSKMCFQNISTTLYLYLWPCALKLNTMVKIWCLCVCDDNSVVCDRFTRSAEKLTEHPGVCVGVSLHCWWCW